jgi:hypothetical protein
MGALSTICLAVVTLWCWRLYSNWKQLNHVPGPFLAGLSDYWRAWYQRRGELRDKLVELHKQHGPIVRYGVRSVSINDPSAVGIIYSDRAGYMIVSKSGSVLTSTKHTDHHHRPTPTKSKSAFPTVKKSIASSPSPTKTATTASGDPSPTPSRQPRP